MSTQELLNAAKLKWIFAGRSFSNVGAINYYDIYLKGFLDGHNLANDKAAHTIQSQGKVITNLQALVVELREKLNEEGY